jgi:tartrate dehydratase alpha subunit/fumarate hydratase class I-like protein
MKSAFSVAMSQDTGCIVMVRTNGQKATIIGSLTKGDSDAFARGVLEWTPPAARVEPEKAGEQRPVYPH